MKIDVTKIPNYDTLSAEDKLKALLEYEVDMSGYVSKASFDKTASELAAIKKKNQENLSEQEKKDLLYKELESKNAELVKKLAISDNTAGYIKNGYAPDLALKAATALAEGNMSEVFNIQQKHLDSLKAEYDKKLLEKTPNPKGGEKDGEITKEKFATFNYEERLKLMSENPTLFKELMK